MYHDFFFAVDRLRQKVLEELGVWDRTSRDDDLVKLEFPPSGSFKRAIQDVKMNDSLIQENLNSELYALVQGNLLGLGRCSLDQGGIRINQHNFLLRELGCNHSGDFNSNRTWQTKNSCLFFWAHKGKNGSKESGKGGSPPPMTSTFVAAWSDLNSRASFFER